MLKADRPGSDINKAKQLTRAVGGTPVLMRAHILSCVLLLLPPCGFGETGRQDFKCPSYQLIGDFSDPTGTTLVVCGYDDKNSKITRADGVEVHRIGSLDIIVLSKDAPPRSLREHFMSPSEDHDFNVWIEPAKGITVERGANLPVRLPGSKWQWVPVSQISTVCDAKGCRFSAARCVLDAKEFNPDPDVLKAVRRDAAPRGTRRDDLKPPTDEALSAKLLVAALAGNRRAAYYLSNMSTFFSMDGALGELLNDNKQLLAHARSAKCPGIQ